MSVFVVWCLSDSILIQSCSSVSSWVMCVTSFIVRDTQTGSSVLTLGLILSHWMNNGHDVYLSMPMCRQVKAQVGDADSLLAVFLCVSVNCLDVHVEKNPNRVALIWERDEPGTEVKVTYRYEHPVCTTPLCRGYSSLSYHRAHESLSSINVNDIWHIW